MPNTLVLNMIVLNEIEIIKRSLDSVSPYIDYWVICDTGSTDGTQEFIREYFNKRGIKGELHQHSWKNFGYNRTYAIQLAKDKGDYILLMDADMELKVKDINFKNELSHDMYLVRQGEGFIYYNARIAKGDLDFEYVEPTHEYLNCRKPNHTQGTLTNVTFDDHADGANRVEKFPRDIAILLENVRQFPHNMRSMFYLGQSYKDNAGNQKNEIDIKYNYEQAIMWYEKRVSYGGWVEEVWYALYMIGQIYEKLNNWNKALEFYLEAYHRHPTRSENIHAIAKYYRIIGKHVLAKFWIDNGIKIKFPSDTLFISQHVYDYDFVYELTVLAWYLKDIKLGQLSCEWMLNSKIVPYYKKSGVLHDMIFYVPCLSDLAHIDVVELFVNKTNSTIFNNHPKHNLSNPSIVLKADGNYLLNVREVSYYYDLDYNEYIYDGTINTINHMTELTDEKLNNMITTKKNNLLNSKIIKFESDDLFTKYPTSIPGFEDLRLVELNGIIWTVGTARITNPTDTNEIVLSRLNSAYEMDLVLRLKVRWPTAEMEKNTWCQKNWVPFVKDNELYILYSSDEMIILKPDLETGECEIVNRTKDQEHDYSLYRGGSQVIKIDTGYLYLIHQIGNNETDHKNKDNNETIWRRYYYHRFVYMDNNYKITKISPLFYLIKKSIEFVSGMTLDTSGKNILITLGVEDRQAYLVRIAKNDVLSMLTLHDEIKNIKDI